MLKINNVVLIVNVNININTKCKKNLFLQTILLKIFLIKK